MQNSITTEEKAVINWQYRALIIAVVIFVLSGILSRLVFHGTIRYAMLLTILPMFWVAISSMKNRISILRLRGQKEYPRGQQALLFGAILLIVEIVTFVFFLLPFSDKYINF